jgi:hypothetical protein
MGFDVSYHPISIGEMHTWYLDRLPEVASGDASGTLAVAKAAGLGEDSTQRLLHIIDKGTNNKPDGSFELGHGYMIAAVQGLFRDYHYTRGSMLSSLVGNDGPLTPYTSPLVGPGALDLPNPSEGVLPSNYASGVWLAPEGVAALLDAYDNDPRIKAAMDETVPAGQINVVLKALRAARDLGVGLLEATEIIEPNPLDLNTSRCVSDLMHCDIEGPLLYEAKAKAQLRAAGVPI